MPLGPHEQLSDEPLAALARGGTFGAWEVFVRRHGPRLLAYCLRLLGDEDEARRVWLEAWEEAWARVRAGLNGLRPGTAAFAAATRLCAERSAGVPAPRPRAGADPGGLEARSQRLLQGLLSLPFAQRAALGLCYFDNLPYAEAQRCLGPASPEARLLCAQGYAALAACLGPGFLREGLP